MLQLGGLSDEYCKSSSGYAIPASAAAIRRHGELSQRLFQPKAVVARTLGGNRRRDEAEVSPYRVPRQGQIRTLYAAAVWQVVP